MNIPNRPHLTKSRLLLLILIVSLFSNILLLNGWVQTQNTLASERNELIKGYADIELIETPMTLSGTKEIKGISMPLTPDMLKNKDTLVLNYNLNGLCLLPANASRLSFIDANNRSYTFSLKDAASNCTTGLQTSTIPLSKFFPTDIPQEIQSFNIQLWYPAFYSVEFSSISLRSQVLGKSTTSNRPTSKLQPPTNTPKPNRAKTPTNTPVIATPLPPTPTSIISIIPNTPMLTPPPTQTPTNAWSIRSVSSMKESKDRVCEPRDSTFITTWINTAAELGVTHIAVETPYDNPSCGDAVAYTKLWVDAIHAKGLNVWHRHMPLAFEGIYNTPKNNTSNYLTQITSYIKSNPTFFKSGDIFTPIPEPQNGGIQGVTYCPQSICIFPNTGEFNVWLRDAISQSSSAFSTIGLSGKIKIGYYGFDGFVAWGDNNPDWHGILEDTTIAAMGNITIDHYPEIVGDTMENDLNELQARYPNTPIVIGEWGTITGDNPEVQVNTSMQAAKRPNVIGFNYWHLGVGGNEALINGDFTKRSQFDEVQSFFR